ncbi:unnamed protein product [Peniophora sp. CBMAI 1063]|nr:unnamed protein product [Peniophora sp. CBMAI 1063]
MARTKRPILAQLARTTHLTREDDAAREMMTSGRPKKKKSVGRGGRKVSYAEAALNRARRIVHGNEDSFNLPVVARRTTADPERTEEMEAGETAFWARCARLHLRAVEHFRGGPYNPCRVAKPYYREWIDRKIEAYTNRARDTLRDGYSGTDDFLTLRRRVAILLQEGAMLDMSAMELEAVGHCGAFIAVGRRIRQTGFRDAVGWFEPAELIEKLA